MKPEELQALAQETLQIVEAGEYTNFAGELIQFPKSRHPTDLYDERFNIELEDGGLDPMIEVTEETTLDALFRLFVSQHYSPYTLGCLNFGSAKNPGGGFLKGTMAQEESLAYSSDLYHHLKDTKGFYDYHRALLDQGLAPLYSSRIMVSHDVTFFRNSHFKLLYTPMVAKVITGAMPKTRDIMEALRDKGFQSTKAPCSCGETDKDPFAHQKTCEYLKVAVYAAALSDVEDEIRYRIKRMFEIAAFYSIEYLVLGAWGCGVFGNDPVFVAETFKEMLQQYKSHFRHITFAISHNSTNYNIFKAILDP